MLLIISVVVIYCCEIEEKDPNLLNKEEHFNDEFFKKGKWKISF